MRKFKAGDVVILKVPLFIKIFGIKTYKGKRVWPPKKAIVFYWRSEMDAYELWDLSMCQQWFATEQGLELES